MSHLALMLFLCCLRLGSLQRVLVHAFWLWKLRWELCRSLILLFCSRRLKQKQLRSVYPWAPQIEDQRIARRQCQMSEPSGGLAAQWDPLSDTIQLINVSHFTPFRCISPFNICKCAVFLCQLSGRATPTFTRMRWERRVMLDLIVISKKQVALVKIWNDLPHFPLTKKTSQLICQWDCFTSISARYLFHVFHGAHLLPRPAVDVRATRAAMSQQTNRETDLVWTADVLLLSFAGCSCCSPCWTAGKVSNYDPPWECCACLTYGSLRIG